MLYGGMDWQQRKAKEPVDSYRLISAPAGRGKKCLKPASTPPLPPPFGIRSHREENAVLEQRRRDKEQTYRLSIGADRWKSPASSTSSATNTAALAATPTGCTATNKTQSVCRWSNRSNAGRRNTKVV